MTDREILGELEAFTDRPRRVVHAALVGMVPSIVDDELAGVRARLAARVNAERQRAQAELEREQSRAWWRAWEQRGTRKVAPFRRLA